MTVAKLMLASASSRRADLLRGAGYEFQTHAVDLIEQPAVSETALDYGRRIALEKAQAAFATVDQNGSWVVLGADTEVVMGRRVYGKPSDRQQAAEMLRSLSGRRHRVISAVAFVNRERTLVIETQTRVQFRTLHDQEIDAYVASKEPFGKAGAYALQGKGALLVSRISGSYTGVVGLPLYETTQALAGFAIKPTWLNLENLPAATP